MAHALQHLWRLGKALHGCGQIGVGPFYAGNERAYLGNTPIRIGGDLIIAIDGQEIETQQDLARAMDQHKSGDTITLTIIRGKQKRDVKVTLGEAQQQA